MSRPATQHKRAAYPSYKPSGVAWLGDVPEHWAIRRLKYTADLINVKVDGADNNLPYTGLEHIESWTGKRVSPNGDATSEGQANLYHRGDVLFGKLRPYLAKAHAADSDGICTGELLVLRPKVVQQKFLVDYVLNPDFVAIVDSSTYGAKMPRANWDFIGNLPALVPPLPEQRSIAAFLDRETARIDALIEKKRRQIELLQEKRSALIRHAVTKGLDPDAKMKDSGIEWLGEIPAHWGTRRLRYLGYCQNGINIGAEKFGTGYPFVSYGDVYNNSALPVVGSGLVESSDADRTRYSVEAGDVFFTRTSETIEEIGFSSVCFKTIPDAVFAGFLIRFRPVGKTLDIGFSEFYFRSDHLRAFFVKEMNLVTRASLSQDLLKDMPVLLPPIEEQAQIASILNQKMTQITFLIKKIHDSIIKLQEHRTALISAAVTGKIDVRKEAI